MMRAMLVREQRLHLGGFQFSPTAKLLLFGECEEFRQRLCVMIERARRIAAFGAQITQEAIDMRIQCRVHFCAPAQAGKRVSAVAIASPINFRNTVPMPG